MQTRSNNHGREGRPGQTCAIVLVSGKRCSGKDFLISTLLEWSVAHSQTEGAPLLRCTFGSTTDLFKEDFTAIYRNEINLERLLTDRVYKEQHRAMMTAHWNEVKKLDRTRYCARLLQQAYAKFNEPRDCDTNSRSVVNLFFVTGVRYSWEIAYFEKAIQERDRTSGNVGLIRLRVQAPDDFKRQMGWVPSAIDADETETELDSYDRWDLVFTNDTLGAEKIRQFLCTDLLNCVRQR